MATPPGGGQKKMFDLKNSNVYVLLASGPLGVDGKVQKHSFRTHTHHAVDLKVISNSGCHQSLSLIAMIATLLIGSFIH